MRGAVPGLASPHPLGGTLPGLYADDSFAQRLCQGLDEVLAPVLATLDCLPAYLDPGTTPADLLAWLAGWVGMAVDPDLPEAPCRELVAGAVRLYVLRGTQSALKTIVELTTGSTPEIVESGGTGWSQEPVGSLPGRSEPLPGRSDPELVIRLPAAGLRMQAPRLTAVIGAFVPAHVSWRLEPLPG